METCLIFKDRLKEQLLEFIEDKEEPFTVEYLLNRCLQPISALRMHEMLCELEDEGKIIRLDEQHYLSTRVLMRRWLKQKIRRLRGEVILDEIELPKDLMKQVSQLLKEKPELGYLDASDFIRDAIRRAVFRLHR
jgi:hypothetical protein